MRKFFSFMLVAAIAIGISSCSKDVEEPGTNPAGQTIATADGDTDWSVFEHLGENVVTDLKNLVGGSQTRAVSDFSLSVTPNTSEISGTGEVVTFTFSKQDHIAWPSRIAVRIAEYPDLDTALPSLTTTIVNPTGENASVPLTVPPFYSSTTNNSKVLVYQYSIDDGTYWVNAKIVLQRSVIGKFYADMSSYENNRIPQIGGVINIYRTQPLNESATFRIVSLDDPTYELADRITMAAGTGYAVEELEIKANPKDNDVIPFVIEYSLQNLPGEWIELSRGIQEPGELFVVTDVVFDGSPTWVEAVGGARRMRLIVESSILEEIEVRIIPNDHSAYDRNFFTPITATAYKEHPHDPSLDNWKFDVEFPAARGAAYTPGEEKGGWHVSATESGDLKSGLNGAGFWAVEYEYDTDVWVGLKSFKQHAYYIGVRNETDMMYKAGGPWILKTQGNWPTDAVEFKASYNYGAGQTASTPVVSITSAYPTTESWGLATPIAIPQNTIGSPIEWRLEYRIDFEMDNFGGNPDLGWETWSDFRIQGTPEYSWEGVGYLLTQLHF